MPDDPQHLDDLTDIDFGALIDTTFAEAEALEDLTALDFEGLGRDEARDNAGRTMQDAAGVTPDEAAEQRRLAIQSGLPRPAVEGNEDEVRQWLDAQIVRQALSDAPVTSQFLTDFENARIVGPDDVQEMADFERSWVGNVFRGIGQSAMETVAGVFTTADAIGRPLRDFYGELGIGDRMLVMDERGRLVFRPITQEERDNSLRSVGDVARQLRAEGAAFDYAPGTTFDDFLDSPIQKFIPFAMETGLVSTPQMALAIASLPTFVISLSGTLANQRAEADERQEATAGDLLAVLPGSVVSALLERVGAKGILGIGEDAIKKAGARAVAKATAKGAAQEAITEAVQNPIETASATAFTLQGFDPADIPRLSLEGFVVGLGFGGAVRAGTATIQSEVIRANQATRRRDVMARTHKIIAQSKLNQRAPEAAIQLVTEMARSDPIGPVLIPAEAWQEFVAKDPEARGPLAQTLGLEGQMEEAELLGSDLRLSEEAHATLLVREDYEEILQDLRFGDDGMTAREAEEFEAGEFEVIEDPVSPAEEFQEVEETAPIRRRFSKLHFDTLGGDLGLDILVNPTRQQARGLANKTASGELRVLRDEDGDLLVWDAGRADHDQVSREVLGKSLADLRVAEHENRTINPQIVGQSVKPSHPIFDPPKPRAEIVAANEIGFQGLFSTAEEAGMTPKQFEAYLIAVAKAAEAASLRRQQTELKREQRRNTEEQRTEREVVREQVRESVNQKPVYGALNAIGAERLDRATVVEMLPEGEAQLAQLPKQNRRNIYAPEGTLHPNVLADLYGFPDGQVMLFAMMDAKPAEEVVELEVDREMDRRHPDLMRRGRALADALEALHGDNQAELLALEINQLREAKDQGRVRPVLLRAAAKDRLQGRRVSDLRPDRFFTAARKSAKEAGRQIRAGNRVEAANAKFRQLLNFEMAKETYRLRGRVDKQQDYLRRFLLPRKVKKLHAKIGDEHLGTIQELLRNQDPDMTVVELHELHDIVKSIERAGRDKDKARVEGSKLRIGQAAEEVAANIRANLKTIQVSTELTRIQKARRFGRSVISFLAHANTILRSIDGFEDLGAAWTNIKAPIDRAVSEIWQPRQREQAKVLRALLDAHYTKDERLRWGKIEIVPGMGRRLSKRAQLSIALNLGNMDNSEALFNTLTQDEISAVQNHLEKRDWEYVQSMWDHLETFWPEIEAAQRRRLGFAPERVEAQEVETPHGKFRGGYYPLKYVAGIVVDNQSAANTRVEDLINSRGAVSKQTRRGHTKERVGDGGREVRLDLGVLHQHIGEVLYDLALGDAVVDAHRIVNHPTTKKAFKDANQVDAFNQLNLWIEDMALGERGPTSAVEAGVARVRANFTVSRLAVNFSTIMLQPLGILQTAVQIGKVNTTVGLWKLLSNPAGRRSAFGYVNEQSKFMEGRKFTLTRDIRDARRLIKDGWVDQAVSRTLGGRAGDMAVAFQRGAAFYGISKSQRFADMVTWLGAQHLGMKQFDGDLAKANELADLMVARTQATGNLSDQSAIERGTTGPFSRQSEWIKLWTTFSSYFIAKNNVAFERFKRTNFRSPVELVNFIVDMFLLYSIEAMLAAVIKGRFDDEDEDNLALFGLREGLYTFFSGVPLGREAVGVLQGFRGGGVIGSVATDVGRVGTQIGQGDIDEDLLYSFISLAGVAMGFPSVQTNKTLRAIDDRNSEWYELFLGPKQD